MWNELVYWSFTTATGFYEVVKVLNPELLCKAIFKIIFSKWLFLCMPWSTLTAPVAAETALTTEQGAGQQTPTEINMLIGYDPSLTLLGWRKMPKVSTSHQSPWEQRTFNRSYDPHRIGLLSTQGPGRIPRSHSQGTRKVVHYLGEDVNTLVVHHGLKDMLLISTMDRVKSLVC